jgi:AraC family transcriptional regulator of adaptative response / DNA-3-methyladenine glycosylase II
MAERGREVLRGRGEQIDAIVGVAREIASGRLDLHWGCSRSRLRARLAAHPGIGSWAAGYVTLRAFGDPDLLLADDPVIREGAARLGLPAESSSLIQHARLWAPWRSYAGMHLWSAARE